MPFISSIQSVIRRIAVSPKKDRGGSLLEPPFLPIPSSPDQNENFYVMDESFTSLSINDEVEKTFYENETFTMYTSDDDFLQCKSVGKSRKRSFSDMELSRTSFPLTSLKPTTTLLLQDDTEPNYSPPAKRAPILRRLRTRLATPPYRPPEVPPLKEDDEEYYLKTIRHNEHSSTSKPTTECINAAGISS